MKKEDIDVFFAGKNLARAYDKHADRFDGTYPPVKNPDALMRGIRELMQAWAEMSEGDPNHITMGIYEVQEVNVGGRKRKARKQSDYVISVDDLAEEYGDPGYSIREIRFADDQVESLSVIEPQNVHWSPDTMENTSDEMRTKYYIGLIYQICENSEGYDQELTPEEEIDPILLSEYLQKGELPADLQQKAYEMKMAKIEQEGVEEVGLEEVATERQPAKFTSIFAYEPDETVEAEEEQTQTQQAQQTDYPLPWDEQEEEAEHRQTQQQDSYFIDDTNASFEELDLDEEELERMFS